MKGPISQFIETHYLHFNAAALVDAAKGYETHLTEGGKMMVTLAGAMSTAELGKSLAEMIRSGKVDIISCTGANLEEDIMNLVAHKHYKRVPNYRDLSPQDEWDLLENHYNRVTDTCIPEEEAFRRLQKHIEGIWKGAQDKGERYFPHEYMYQILNSGELEQYYEIDPKNSWMLAAAERNLPIVVPGWEDSTMGNIFASYVIKGELQASTMKSGIEYMTWLADWYVKNSDGKGVGFFQIGGGIAGDFPICVVPMLYQDMEMENIPFWSYFCQISDSTTSYGSYSGAVPNEKITWPEIAEHATATTLVLGEFSRSKKSKTLNFNFTAGAFVIDETGICVTSHHVAKERNSRGLVAMTRDGQVFPVKSVLATDQVNDLIIIQLDLPPSLHLPALALATAPAPVGSSIGVISHPNGQFYLFTSGHVARHALWRDPAGDQSFMSVTADFAQGSSGCAVLNDHGAVVGVVNNTESIYYEDAGEKNKNKQQDLQMVVKNATPITLLRKMITPPTPIPPP